MRLPRAGDGVKSHARIPIRSAGEGVRCAKVAAAAVETLSGGSWLSTDPASVGVRLDAGQAALILNQVSTGPVPVGPRLDAGCVEAHSFQSLLPPARGRWRARARRQYFF